MILYTKTEFCTLQEAYEEARMLCEALAALGPGFPALPRTRSGVVQFNRNSDGGLESILLEAEPAADEE